MYSSLYNFSDYLAPSIYTGIPRIGGKRWDGSRWVNKEEAEDGAYYRNYFDRNGGLDSPDLGAAFGDDGSFGSFAGSGAGDRAAGAMAGAAGKAALGAVGKGLALGAFGVPASDAFGEAVAGMANPGTLGGVLGAGIDGALGLESLGMTKAGIVAAAGMLGGPLAGALAGIFGGFVTNAIADFADVRAFENVKDQVENTYGHGFKGLSVGAKLADVAKGYSDMAPEAADLAFGQTLADTGLATSVQGVRGYYSALENDLYGELANTMSLSPEAQATRDSFGILGGLASKGMGVVSDAPATPAGTTTQGGTKGAPSAQAPDTPSAVNSPSPPGTPSNTPSPAPDAKAADTKGDSDADNNNDGGGNGDPFGGMGDPAADGLNTSDPGDTGPDGFGSSDPGAAGVGSGSVGGL